MRVLLTLYVLLKHLLKIVCIVETFVEDFQSDVFHGYNVFCKPAVKFTRQGRHSGGVICLVKKKIRTLCTQT